MSIKETNSEWTAGIYCYWHYPYVWSPASAISVLHCPEGMVSLYLSFDFEKRAEANEERVLQEFSMDTIIDGRFYTTRQERSRRDWLTVRGAMIVAHRWLKELRA